MLCGGRQRSGTRECSSRRPQAHHHHHHRPSTDSHAGQLRKNGWVLGRQLEAWTAGSYARPVCCSRSCESGNYQPTFVHRLKLIESVLLPSSAHRMISRASEDRRASSPLPPPLLPQPARPHRSRRENNGAPVTGWPPPHYCSLHHRAAIDITAGRVAAVLPVRRAATACPRALPAGCMRR